MCNHPAMEVFYSERTHLPWIRGWCEDLPRGGGAAAARRPHPRQRGAAVWKVDVKTGWVMTKIAMENVG